MHALTLLLFFVYTWGLGYSLTFFLKEPKNYIEKAVIRIGVGLAALPLLISLFGLLHIPIDWKIFLPISLVIPLYRLFKIKKPDTANLKFSKSHLFMILVIVMFSFSFYANQKGAFSYPYFEDEDPWTHSYSVKYIAMEKTIYEPSVDSYLFPYLDARPPGYDGIMALLLQTSESDMIWVLKFFNAFIVSLSVLFFYILAKQFMKNMNMALFATFIFLMIPCYLSHFIWTHSLSFTLIIFSFALFPLIDHEKKWAIPAAVAVAGVFLTQETNSIKFALLFALYWGIRSLINKKFMKDHLYPFLGGIFLSVASWWGIMLVKYGGIKGLYQLGISQAIDMSARKYFVDIAVHPSIKHIYFGRLGSATTQHGIYTFSDFFFSKPYNYINNPIGVGWVICILALIGALFIAIKYKDLLFKKEYIAVAFAWLIFTFLGIHGGVHWWSPIGLFSFRFWSLFAIPVSIMAAYGFWFILSAIKLKHLKIAALIVILVLVFFTSGINKYKHSTTVWPMGVYLARYPGVLPAFNWITTNIPVDTPIFEYSGREHSISAINMYSCGWCDDVISFREDILHKDVSQVYPFLKEKGYKYVLIVPGYVYANYEESLGENITQELIMQRIDEFAKHERISVAYQNNDALLFRIN